MDLRVVVHKKRKVQSDGVYEGRPTERYNHDLGVRPIVRARRLEPVEHGDRL